MQHILKCAEFGMPLDSLDLRMIAKNYLDNHARNIRCFKNNLPGNDWAKTFLKRHREDLSERKCQNVNRARAKVAREQVQEYFSHLERSLKDVPPNNILNYDETNCSDDPGTKKMLYKRGCKYPERIMNSSTACISIMFG